MTRYAIGFALVFLAVSAAGPAWGEGVGLHGRVFALDENGDVHDVVVGAEIRLVDASGALAARATSGAGGYYRVTLPAGTYSYKVTAKGYKDEDVKRGVRQELTDGFSVFDFALTPGKNDSEGAQDTPDDGGGDTARPPGGTTIPAEIGTLYGIVHERSGEGTLVGIANALVRLARDDGDGDTQVRTGGSGAYEIVLSTGPWHATAYAPGYEPLADADVIQITKGGRTNRDFLFVRPQPPTVPEGQGIRGTIRLLTDPDASGRTRPTPTVSITPLTPKATRGAAPGVDAQGAYRSDLVVGRYEVVASATGYETARSGPRAVYAGRSTQVDLTLRPSPAQPKPAAPPPKRTPVPTPDPVPETTPDPIPTPDPTPKPEPPPIDRGASLALQVLERGPDRILRAVVGARIVLGGRGGEGAALQSDERGWCHVPLAPGAQHIAVHGRAGDTATLGVGLLPAERFVEVVRRDARGSAHLEFLLPVAVQVVLGPEEPPERTPEPRPGERGDDDPDATDPRPTLRIAVRVVEPGPTERETRPLDGARVNVLLGDQRVDTGIARGGSFTSKPLPVVEGYYLFAEKEGYHPAEEVVSTGGGPTTVVLHPVEAGREPPPRETPPREPPDERPPGEQPPREAAPVDLLIRVVGPDDRPLVGATAEVRWGRDEVRARDTTRGRDGLIRVRVPRDEYWVVAWIEVPGRGTARGEAGIPREWNPSVPITVRLHLPGEEGPGEPPPRQPPAQPPGRAQPAPLQIQVLGPDGRALPGAQVEVRWGPEGRSQVRGRAVTQGSQGIARFHLPREDYGARAVAQIPGGGRLVGQVGVGRNWNPAVPIRIRLHQEGGPTPPPRQPTPTQPGVPKPPTKPPQQPPPVKKAQLTVRVSGLDLNAPISTLQPLGGARVTVRGNGGSWSGNTNAGGQWGIALAPGSYQIEVTAAGMERAAQAGVTMGARSVTKELTIKLRGPR